MLSKLPRVSDEPHLPSQEKSLGGEEGGGRVVGTWKLEEGKKLLAKEKARGHRGIAV